MLSFISEENLLANNSAKEKNSLMLIDSSNSIELEKGKSFEHGDKSDFDGTVNITPSVVKSVLVIPACSAAALLGVNQFCLTLLSQEGFSMCYAFCVFVSIVACIVKLIIVKLRH